MKTRNEVEWRKQIHLMNLHNGSLGVITGTSVSDFGTHSLLIYKPCDDFTYKHFCLDDVDQYWAAINEEEFNLLLSWSETSTSIWGEEYGVCPPPVFDHIMGADEEASYDIVITKNFLCEGAAEMVSKSAFPDSDPKEILLTIASLPMTQEEQFDELVYPVPEDL